MEELLREAIMHLEDMIVNHCGCLCTKDAKDFVDKTAAALNSHSTKERS